MIFKKQALFVILLLLSVFSTNAQEKMGLDSILSVLETKHPVARMYDAQVNAADAAAAGARSWMAPELGTGFFMTPYNPSLWKKSSGSNGMGSSNGMGQYMVSVQQMLPNKKEQNANEKYMRTMSTVDKDGKLAALNELYAEAKTSYYTWVIAEKKQKVLQENESLLNLMIRSAELRYKNNLGKLNTYYKLKAALGELAGQRIQLENSILQQKIKLNTLLYRDPSYDFAIDTVFRIKDYGSVDTGYFLQNRSDIRAVEDNIVLTNLKQNLELAKLKPQFGIRYEHMFGFGGQPMQYNLMAMVKLPVVSWAAKESRANIESLKWQSRALDAQKQMMANEAWGQAHGLLADFQSKQRQAGLYQKEIIPAMHKNFTTAQLSYEQNTGDLFELFDAWEALTMSQMQYLDQLQDLLAMQVELDKILERK